MGPVINAVEANVNFIAGELESANIDPRFALVEFGGLGAANPGLTTDLTDASGLSTALATLTPSGGFEPGVQATQFAHDNVSFRPDAGACYVMITDEDSDGGDLTATTSLLQAQGATWLGIVNIGIGNTPITYGPNAGSLAASTGGSIFGISSFVSDPQPVLDALIADCVTSFGLIDVSPETATNPVGTSHTVTATVSDNGGNLLAGEEVTFEVISGPNAGANGVSTTDANGQATFTYTDSAGPGTDIIRGSFVDSNGVVRSDQVEKIWEDVQTTECPDDIIISNYAPGASGSVDVTNVGTTTIDLAGCSLAIFNVFTELSIGAQDLSGSLAPAQTVQVAASLPSGPGGLAIYDAPAFPNGTPGTTTNEITGMTYINAGMVWSVAHLSAPANDSFYNCIYGGSGPGPWTERNSVGSCIAP